MSQFMKRREEPKKPSRFDAAKAYASEHGVSFADAMVAVALADGDPQLHAVKRHAEANRMGFYEALAERAGESPRARAHREAEAAAAAAWHSAVRQHLAENPHLADHPNGRALAGVELQRRIAERRQAIAAQEVEPPSAPANANAIFGLTAVLTAREIQAAARGTPISAPAAPAVPPMKTPAAVGGLDLLRERLKWGRR